MILPPGSMLTFTYSGSPSSTASVAVSQIKYKYTRQPFQRLEFSHKRLLEAPNPDGSMPIVVQLIGNRPVIYFTGCGDEKGRDVTPDDDVYDDIYKRFDIKRYEIVGATSLAAEIDKIFAVSKEHQIRLARFDAFIQEARANVSVDFLEAMQSETFSYLTTTGLQMAGLSLGAYSPETNLLITDFQPDVTYEIPTNSSGTTSTVLRTWSMVVENRVIVPERSTTW